MTSLTKTKECKHGTFTYRPDDAFIGRSLELYGEYSENEVLLLSKILSPGDVVVEAGANIGTLTVPMLNLVGPTGTVIAFEPQPDNCNLLRANVFANMPETAVVEVREEIVTDHNGFMSLPALGDLDHKNFGRIEVGHGSLKAKCTRIDDLNLQKLRLLKADVEGHELSVLRGARETIKRLKPLIYVENDRPENNAEMIAMLVDLGYRLYWHRPPLWNFDNFRGERVNVFGDVVNVNMLGVPEHIEYHVSGLDQVADIRYDDDIYNREIARWSRISQARPDDLFARLMHAHFLNLMQRTDEADALIDENLRRDPTHQATRQVRGMHELQRGNWKTAWPLYEMRYEMKYTKPFGDRPHQGEKWDGKWTTDPVLIWCEQGYGDSIMFARFLRRAYALAPNAFLEVHASQYELFESSGLVPVGGIYRFGRKLPPYTKHISIPSLPAALGIETDEQIRCPPYMRADEGLIETWARKNFQKIGICCRGSPMSERPYTRDIDSDLFRPITAKFGPFVSLEDHGQFHSYADTAALISTLDLVISVDTSVVHLAGALGVPTWLLLSVDPDWRWGLKGESTVWYDNTRIFRKSTVIDWQPVVDRVGEELEKRYG